MTIEEIRDGFVKIAGSDLLEKIDGSKISIYGGYEEPSEIHFSNSVLENGNLVDKNILENELEIELDNEEYNNLKKGVNYLFNSITDNKGNVKSEFENNYSADIYSVDIYFE